MSRQSPIRQLGTTPFGVTRHGRLVLAPCAACADDDPLASSLAPRQFPSDTCFEVPTALSFAVELEVPMVRYLATVEYISVLWVLLAVFVALGVAVAIGPALFAGGAEGDPDSAKGQAILWGSLLVLSTVPMCLSSIYKEIRLKDHDLDAVFLNGRIAAFQLLFGYFNDIRAVMIVYCHEGSTNYLITEKIFCLYRCTTGRFQDRAGIYFRWLDARRGKLSGRLPD